MLKYNVDPVLILLYKVSYLLCRSPLKNGYCSKLFIELPYHNTVFLFWCLNLVHDLQEHYEKGMKKISLKPYKTIKLTNYPLFTHCAGLSLFTNKIQGL